MVVDGFGNLAVGHVLVSVEHRHRAGCGLHWAFLLKASTRHIDSELVNLVLSVTCKPHLHAICKCNGLRNVEADVAKIAHRWGSATIYCHDS